MTLQSTLFATKVLDIAHAEGLDSLKRRCAECRRCDLHTTRIKSVFGEGNIHQPPVCFVGDAPGLADSEEGKPFVSHAGDFLNRVIGAMKLRRSDVYVCHAAACRPPDNREPLPKEMDACFEYLVGQIRAIQPRILVTLGASAFAAFFGGKSDITKIRGKWKDWEGIPLMPTFHPSYIRRRHSAPDFVDMKKLMWSDMQQVLHKLKQN